MARKAKPLVTKTPSGKIKLLVDDMLFAELVGACDSFLSIRNNGRFEIKGMAPLNSLASVVLMDFYNRHFASQVLAVKRSITLRISEAMALSYVARYAPSIFQRTPTLANLFMQLHQKIS